MERTTPGSHPSLVLAVPRAVGRPLSACGPLQRRRPDGMASPVAIRRSLGRLAADAASGRLMARRATVEVHGPGVHGRSDAPEGET